MVVLAWIVVVLYTVITLMAVIVRGGDKTSNVLGGIIAILLFIAYTWGIYYLVQQGVFN